MISTSTIFLQPDVFHLFSGPGLGAICQVYSKSINDLHALIKADITNFDALIKTDISNVWNDIFRQKIIGKFW